MYYEVTHPYYRRTGLYVHYTEGETFFDGDFRKWEVLSASVYGGYWHLNLKEA